MQNIFDKQVERRNTSSLKWDVPEGELPMWVADMDFQTAPEILDVVMKRAEHGIFGYTSVPEEWYQAYVDWWKKRHGFHMQREWLVFCTGVVPAISSIVRKLASPAENVLIQTPVYNIFFNCILNNGRNVLENQLRYDGGSYSIDFEDLEQKLADPQTTMMILCNPHNPVGKIWDRDTLEKIGEMCFKYNVIVVSDEIHCDLAEPGTGYIPFASVSEKCRENSITCIAPTKAFNLAGLQTAAVSVPNKVLRHKVWRGLNTDEVAEPNVFAAEAAVAAFTKGEAWLDNLREYISENRQCTAEFIKKNIPQIMLVPSEATYLLWLDCHKITECSRKLCKYIRKNTGLYLSEGSQYGKSGEGFLRMNIACPRDRLYDGLERLKKGVESFTANAV
ncbi:MAG TPA: cystathionine beta-lyase [Lachnospiraceae bacterium]|nr:cystathionine beta-lyase [Lachnospiraceae bacterium]